MDQRNVTFEFNNVFHLNGRILEVQDMIPESLAAVVNEFSDEIADHLTQLELSGAEVAGRSPRTRPSILLARIANLRSISEALTFEGIDHGTNLFTNPHYLQPEYMPYWTHLKKSTHFTPEARRVSFSDIRLSGIWFGLR